MWSVAEGKKFHFSKGNLVATINASGAPTAWKFAANQYDCIGNATANTSIGSTAGDIDLFGWSTDAASNNWGIHTKMSATEGFTTGNFNDWGKNIGDGTTWRTLSKDEWTYLFNTRTASTVSSSANARYVKATTRTPCTSIATLSSLTTTTTATTAVVCASLQMSSDIACNQINESTLGHRQGDQIYNP